MDQTSKLKLPYILAAQSQKHVTHNEALRVLDALVQLAVVDMDLSAPPGSPSEGACYIVGAGPTGAWAGHAAQIAAFQDAAWAFYVPLEGWLAWVGDEDTLYAFDGTHWVPSSGGGGSVNPVSLVGVAATADATNRLSVASPASLFNHEGAGHQLKINKAAAGDTGSVLFQTGFSGRAEFGLAGDDDFHVKVSADGSTWHQAIVINRSNGALKGPGIRERLTANRTYYVRTDGNDGNNGLANTSGGAFLTLQAAISTVAALDISIYNVTIQVAAGTYTSGVALSGRFTGVGSVTVAGSSAVISTTSANCFTLSNGAALTLSGLKLQTTTSGDCVNATNGAVVSISTSIEFGACAGNHMAALATGSISVGANYTISGGAARHILADTVAAVSAGFSRTITLTGTPNFSAGFVAATGVAAVRSAGNTYSGACTGKRYDASVGGAINTFGSGANYFPGDVAGTATGGVYA
jgi:hypothetical protein